ncbi:MAG TPA: hypothetical protein VGR71_18020, partial [Nitrospira sp.]|nr:hypothetical protein [Nitrospira sp.]
MLTALIRDRRTFLRPTSMLTACVLILISFYSTWAAEAGTNAEAIEQAKRATVGILEDTQDPRTP